MSPVSSQSVSKIGKWAASKKIVQASWVVLKGNKKLLWFPVLSMVISLVFFIGAVLLISSPPAQSWLHSNVQEAYSGSNAVFLLGAFLYYLIYFCIVNFFTTGIFVLAHGIFTGQNLAFVGAIKAAAKNSNKIFLWSLISATVGLILNIVAEKCQPIQKIMVFLLGASWGILTYFTLPALVIGQQSLIQSCKNSVHIIHKTWGETAIIGLGVNGLIFGIPVLLSVVAIFLTAHFAPHFLHITILAIIAFLFLMHIISATLNAIFKTALYEYATTGTTPEGFSAELMHQAMKKN